MTTTTTTTQNTVFTVTVKAPARCETGDRLAKERADAVKAALSMDDFFLVEGTLWLKFLEHVLMCTACLEYEQSRGRLK